MCLSSSCLNNGAKSFQIKISLGICKICLCISLNIRRSYSLFETSYWIDNSDHWPDTIRVVASLTVPGGKEFHVPHFSSNRDQFFLCWLCSFSSSLYIRPFGWATRPPRTWRPCLRHWCCQIKTKLALADIGLW